MLSSIAQKNVKFAVDSFKPEEYAIDWHGIDPGAGTVLYKIYSLVLHTQIIKPYSDNLLAHC
jgi:hypothetical protein